MILVTISIILSVIDTITSRKSIDVFDYSALHFLVGWVLVISFINDHPFINDHHYISTIDQV